MSLIHPRNIKLTTSFPFSNDMNHDLSLLIDAATPLREDTLTWTIPYETDVQQGSERQLIDFLASYKGDREGKIILSKTTQVYFSLDESQKRWDFGIFVEIESDRSSVSNTLVSLIEVARKLFQIEDCFCSIERESRGAFCIPELPVTGQKTHVCTATKEDVDEAYDEPQIFWQSWQVDCQVGRRFLLTRALECEDDLAFLKSVSKAQWAMARAVKPGLTEYYDPDPQPEEARFFNTGPHFLQPVGYLEDKLLAEFSAVLEPGRHVSPLQIYQIAEMVASQSLPDGRPLQTVRVVFYEEAMAQREKRPLLDVGAKVYFENRDGDLVELRTPIHRH